MEIIFRSCSRMEYLEIQFHRLTPIKKAVTATSTSSIVIWGGILGEYKSIGIIGRRKKVQTTQTNKTITLFAPILKSKKLLFYWLDLRFILHAFSIEINKSNKNKNEINSFLSFDLKQTLSNNDKQEASNRRRKQRKRVGKNRIFSILNDAANELTHSLTV